MIDKLTYSQQDDIKEYITNRIIESNPRLKNREDDIDSIMNEYGLMEMFDDNFYEYLEINL